MKIHNRFLRSSLLTSLLAFGLAAPLSAQVFVGSDDFNSGETAKWDLSYRLNGAGHGELSFSNNRLDFSKDAGLGNQFRLWNSDGTVDPNVTPVSFTTSWVMSLNATNTMTGLGTGEFASIGLNLFNDDSEYFSVMLNVYESSLSFRTEGTNFIAVDTAIGDGTDVTLQISWDASAQTLGTAYSFDGSNFISGASFNPVTEWANETYPVSNGFNFGVFGNSNTAGAISVGSMYSDNFSVSAVPEPSTYAAIAGAVMLGFAAWQRRRRSKLA